MRTNVEIDDELMRDALRLSKLPSKRAVVDEALRQFVMRQKRQKILGLFGKVDWQGDLDQSRQS